MPDSFGARMRETRERQQVALTTIAEQTKIKVSLLEALERDDVSHWPSGIFRRSFIRAYATAIGLDPDETVREFLECHPDPSDVAAAVPGAAATAPAGVTAASSTAPPRASVAAAADIEPDAVLRLKLADTGVPFSGGRLLAGIRQRW